MKILQSIETSGPGGAENFIIRVCQSKNYGNQFVVCLLKTGWLPEQLERIGVKNYILPRKGFHDIGWLRQVAKLLRQESIQVVHSHEFTMNVQMAFIAALYGKKHIATVHGKNYYSKKAVRRLAYRLISRRTRLVAVSEDIKRYLISAVGVEAGRIHVIPNGIDVDSYQYDEAHVLRARSAFALNDDDFVMCAVGNLYEVKGHRYLIEAVGLLANRHKNIKLLIAGRGNQLDSLQRQIEQLGINSNVSLLGFRDDVENILAASDLFVMPSLSEGLPFSLLEAMAAKLPVVVTSVGGMPDLVRNRETGLLVAPADAHELASALDELIRNPQAASDMASRAHQNVKSNFAYSKMLDEYNSLYEH